MAGKEGVIPFCGCICCFSACFTEFPKLIGCAGVCDCLCYHSRYRSCKLPDPNDPDDKDLWFLCSRGESNFSPIKSLCSQQSQCFCVDSRASLPPIEEIPSLITICFFTLFYKGQSVMQFAKPLDELDKMVSSTPGTA